MWITAPANIKVRAECAVCVSEKVGPCAGASLGDAL